MSETTSFKLPLLQPSQAQKHVTVNEALVRLDGMAQITLLSRAVVTPPAAFSDGDCYAVPTGGSDGWSGQDGKLALASNGGWIFVDPRDGWTAWLVDEHKRVQFVSGDWLDGLVTASPNGANSRFAVEEVEFVLGAGGAQNVGLTIPATSMIFACSARVVNDITGDATSWTLDIEDGSVTFGTGMGMLAGSYCSGLLSNPTAIYSDKEVRISPVGGNFTGGTLRVSVHYYRIEVPEFDVA